MVDFEKTNITELEKLLSDLKESLEELEEERILVLGQTGIHLPGATVRKYEAEAEELTGRINELKDLIHKKRDN